MPRQTPLPPTRCPCLTSPLFFGPPASWALPTCWLLTGALPQDSPYLQLRKREAGSEPLLWREPVGLHALPTFPTTLSGTHNNLPPAAKPISSALGALLRLQRQGAVRPSGNTCRPLTTREMRPLRPQGDTTHA